jgi:glycosyltransferase involved in cell wall biosynthesis
VTADSPLVSIVTPTFERAELLKHTLASIRLQTYPAIEHIVIDGGSTDRTVELLRQAQGKHSLRWLSEPDEGMYHAINKGLGMATGDILAYLNSDDLYFPWTVETVVDAFRRHPEADFVFGDALAIDEQTGETRAYWLAPFDLDFVRRKGFLAQPAVFWRRRAYESMGPFDTRLQYVADCAYWMRAGRDHTFHKVNEFLAVERNHSSTLRESLGDEVWPELARLRTSYVRLSGARHQRMLRRHRVRERYYYRLYTMLLLLQSVIPRRLRRGPWSRMLGAGLEFDRLRAALSLVPRLGHRLAGDNVFAPAPRWLDQVTEEKVRTSVEALS